MATGNMHLIKVYIINNGKNHKEIIRSNRLEFNCGPAGYWLTESHNPMFSCTLHCVSDGRKVTRLHSFPLACPALRTIFAKLRSLYKTSSRGIICTKFEFPLGNMSRNLSKPLKKTECESECDGSLGLKTDW